MMSSPLNEVAVTIRLDGSEMLVQALNDHMATCALARDLAVERDKLREELTALRLRYEGSKTD